MFGICKMECDGVCRQYLLLCLGKGLWLSVLHCLSLFYGEGIIPYRPNNLIKCELVKLLRPQD